MFDTDPRYYQIAVLSSLVVYGLFVLAFDVALVDVILVLATVLLTQLACTKFLRLPRFDPKSGLISGLSLCLLLRTNSTTLLISAAVITIVSKFLIRYRGKHVFNPTNFGIALVVFVTGQAWVSPGQWGSGALFAALLALCGSAVVFRAARSDVTFAFLLFYSGLLLWRAIHLGDPLTIPLHQLESGALILFSFFMISDPKTTPNSRAARILFAALVAGLAYHLRFSYFSPNALIYALVLVSPLTVLLDYLFPAERYEWRGGGLSLTNPVT